MEMTAMNKDDLWKVKLAIWGNVIRWNETKHVELEQFWHVFTSRGFDSVSWAFLFSFKRQYLENGSRYGQSYY